MGPSKPRVDSEQENRKICWKIKIKVLGKLDKTFKKNFNWNVQIFGIKIFKKNKFIKRIKNNSFKLKKMESLK